MAGMGRGSTSGGNRGDSGSGGAFTGGGLQTGSKWHGTKAHFDANGNLQGYTTKGGAPKTPTGADVGVAQPTAAPPPKPVAALPVPPKPRAPKPRVPAPPVPPVPVPPKPKAPAPVPPPRAPLPPGYYPANYQYNPTAMPQHTQNVPGKPGFRQSTYDSGFSFHNMSDPNAPAAPAGHGGNEVAGGKGDASASGNKTDKGRYSRGGEVRQHLSVGGSVGSASTMGGSRGDGGSGWGSGRSGMQHGDRAVDRPSSGSLATGAGRVGFQSTPDQRATEAQKIAASYNAPKAASAPAPAPAPAAAAQDNRRLEPMRPAPAAPARPAAPAPAVAAPQRPAARPAPARSTVARPAARPALDITGGMEPSVNGAYRRGGEVRRPAAPKKPMAKKPMAKKPMTKGKSTPKAEALKRPIKKKRFSFAKGGAVEEFMRRYPDFKAA